MEGTRSWLDNLKLRVGAGITGNSGGVGAYSTETNAMKSSVESRSFPRAVSTSEGFFERIAAVVASQS